MEEALLKACAMCVISVAFGGLMIWRGATGEAWRRRFTGDAVVPPWTYVATGVLTIMGTMGYVAVTILLTKM